MAVIRHYRKRTHEFVDLIVDESDYDVVSKLRLNVIKNSEGNLYIYAKVGGKYISLQKVIMETNSPGVTVDHVNRNTLDYRRSNLRILTKSKNNINRIIKKRNARPFIYPGVSLCSDGLFEARLNIDKKLILRKKFKNVSDAIDARKEAEKLHGIIWTVSNNNPDFVKEM